uniref:Uncharacterized protein n=1 Tax=Anguilla anguilla TaxID=7936 RepID=A0A0E9WIF0_ANGAN
MHPFMSQTRQYKFCNLLNMVMHIRESAYILSLFSELEHSIHRMHT